MSDRMANVGASLIVLGVVWGVVFLIAFGVTYALVGLAIASLGLLALAATYDDGGDGA